MTAHLASIGPVGWAAIVVGSLIVFRLVSPSFRAARAFIDSCDPGEDEHVEWMPELPPVPALPHPLDDAGWDSWVSVWPADTPLEVMEQAIFDRRFEQMPLVADDLRRSA